MAHYAQIDDNNKVIQVLVISNEETDPIGWLVSNIGGTWAQTSYNTRGGVHYGQDGKPDGGNQIGYNYAGIGYNYDSNAKAFYVPSPYSSWIINTNTYTWEPPVPRPTDNNNYFWNELTKSWSIVNPQQELVDTTETTSTKETN